LLCPRHAQLDDRIQTGDFLGEMRLHVLTEFGSRQAAGAEDVKSRVAALQGCPPKSLRLRPEFAQHSVRHFCHGRISIIPEEVVWHAYAKISKFQFGY